MRIERVIDLYCFLMALDAETASGVPMTHDIAAKDRLFLLRRIVLEPGSHEQ